jgi:hypothetical protein
MRIPMQLHILFGQRKENYPGEFAPEPLLTWSEHEVEDNPDRFRRECDEQMRSSEPHFEAFRVFKVAVDATEIKRLLTQTPEVVGVLQTTFSAT